MTSKKCSCKEKLSLENVCRVCLCNIYPVKNIFETKIETGDLLYEVLNFIYGLDITANDPLPACICLPCMWKATEFFGWKKNAHFAKSQLTEVVKELLNVQIKDEIDIEDWNVPNDVTSAQNSVDVLEAKVTQRSSELQKSISVSNEKDSNEDLPLLLQFSSTIDSAIECSRIKESEQREVDGAAPKIQLRSLRPRKSMNYQLDESDTEMSPMESRKSLPTMDKEGTNLAKINIASNFGIECRNRKNLKVGLKGVNPETSGRKIVKDTFSDTSSMTENTLETRIKVNRERLGRSRENLSSGIKNLSDKSEQEKSNCDLNGGISLRNTRIKVSRRKVESEVMRENEGKDVCGPVNKTEVAREMYEKDSLGKRNSKTS